MTHQFRERYLELSRGTSYGRAMDAMDAWLDIAREIPGFNVALDVGDAARREH